MTIPSRAAAGLALAALLPVPALAQGAFADAASIDRAVVDFTGAPVGTPGGAGAPVDRRLRLAACSGPLALAFYGSRRDSVRVECPDAGGWRIFVALRAAASVAPAAQLIARGDMVSIVVAGGGFSVTQSGEAMEGGAQGEWIRVKPPGSAEPVRAQVVRPGRVNIPL